MKSKKLKKPKYQKIVTITLILIMLASYIVALFV